MRKSGWIGAFFSRIRNRVSTGLASRRRRSLFVISNPQPCESRTLLSANAVNDFAKLRGAGDYSLNVLTNDATSSGGLRISNVGTSSGGATQAIDTDADGYADRIHFTPNIGFSGITSFTYSVIDSAGSTSTASVTVEVLSTTSEITSGSGKLLASGGIGGTGHQASVKTSYTPTTQGNFQIATTSFSGYSEGITLGGVALTSTGVQDLTRTTTSTYVNSANWSYIETATWNFNITVSNGGSSSHTWGGYTYTLSTIVTNGVNVTSLDYDTYFFYDITEVTTSSTMSYTNHGIGNSSFDLFISNTNDPAGPDSGLQVMTESSLDSTIGSGTFSYATSGGSVSGTLAGSSLDSKFNTSTVSWVESAPNLWSGVGTGSFNGNGNNSFTWAGSGTYGDANFSGTISNDSGGDGGGYSYSGLSTMLPDFSWTSTGSGSSHFWSNRDFAYTGTGTYSSSANGVTRSGTNDANGYNNTSSSGSAGYAMVAGKWEEVSGTAGGGSKASDHWGYSGTGSYTSSSGGTVTSGTLNENGSSDSWSNSNWSSVRNLAGWTSTGTGTVGASGNAHFDYSGSGTFTSTSSSGGDTLSGTVNQNGSRDTKSNHSENWAINSQGAWEITGGSGTDSGSDFSHSDYDGSGSYSLSGTDGQFGNWTVSGTRTIDGLNESGNSWIKDSSVVAGVWAVTSGTASGSGKWETNSGSSGSGSYSYNDGTSILSGTVTHSATDNAGGDWKSDSTLVLGATSGSGDNWALTSGSANNSSSGNETLTFILNSGTYSYSVPGGSVSGSLTAFGFRTWTSNSNSKESVVAGKWELTSGQATNTFSTGQGAGYSGSGSFSHSGDMLENGVDVGDWSFGGTITESGNVTDSIGWYSKNEVKNGTWQETDFGSTASGSSDDTYAWDGKGNYTRGVFTGSTTRGSNSFVGDNYSAKNSAVTGVSGTAGASSKAGIYDGYDESGTVTIGGATGLYTTGAHNKSTSQESLSYTLNPLTKAYEATSGSSTVSNHHDDKYAFSGSSTTVNGGTTSTVKYNFGVSNTSDSNGDWTLNVGTGKWNMTSGSSTVDRGEWSHLDTSTKSGYTTANGVSGTQTATQSTNYDYISNVKSKWAGGAWSTSGSGTEDFSYDVFSGYSASGSIPNGTYSESGHDHTFRSGHVDHKLTAGGWLLTGKGSGGGDSDAKKSESTTTSWTSGGMTGSTTTKSSLNANSNYSYDEVFASGKWTFTNGSGSGHIDESFSTSSSGSGSYSVVFGNGQGTATGTQHADSHTKRGYTYDETYTFNVANQTWSTFGSGSGSADGHSHADYNAHGTYGSSSNGGSLTVTGNNDSKWDAKWDWNTAGDFHATLNTSGSSLADSTEKSWYSSKTTTTLTGNYTGTTTSESSGSAEVTSHADSNYQTKKTWNGSDWTQDSSGQSNSWIETTNQGNSKYSWNWTLTEPNHTRTDVGYSSFGSYTHEKNTWNSSYSGKSSSDGSSTMSYSSGGSHVKDWQFNYAYSQSWTETWSYGGMSGSGSGGGYSYTSSGSSYGSGSSSGSEFSIWSGTWTITIPATGGSGSGSGGGGGLGNNLGGGGVGAGGGAFQVAPPLNGAKAPTPGPDKATPEAEKLQKAVADLVKGSGISKWPYRADKDATTPGRDCDDAADAIANYLANKLREQGFTGATTSFLYIDAGGNAQHLMTVVEQDGKYILIDPQTGTVTGVLDSKKAVENAAFEIMKNKYNAPGLKKSPTGAKASFIWIPDRAALERMQWSPHNEPPAWHTDPEIRKFIVDGDATKPGIGVPIDPAFYPQGKAPQPPATAPARSGFWQGFWNGITGGLF